jgi:hypothetical protein
MFMDINAGHVGNMIKAKYVTIAILGGFIICLWFFTKKTTCVFKIKQNLTIATIKYGPFSEYAPVTGKFSLDTIRNISIVKVTIDELYLPRIVKGMKATTQLNDTIYPLEIVTIDPAGIDGRFTVDMNFKNEIPANMVNGQSLRLRLELNEPINALLVPVGGFYKDTGGEWIFLLENENRAVRRGIRLGRKNGDYFEILEGLKRGDQVITSPYEPFEKGESLDLNELRKSYL